MLDKNDLRQIRQIMKEEVQASEKRMLGKIEASEQRMIGRVEVMFKVSEEKLTQMIVDSENKLRGEIKQMGDDIGNMIDGVLLTQLSEKADKKYLQTLSEKTAEHEGIFKKIRAAFVN